MNISGFQINKDVETVYCNNAYCSSIIPLCFAGISPGCVRNRSVSAWNHLSIGEHVCSICFDFLNNIISKQRAQTSDTVWRHRLNCWRRNWLRKSSPHGRRRILSIELFLASNYLPWWLKCKKCGKWRHIPPQTSIGSINCTMQPDTFHCALLIKMTDDPCSWTLDERVHIVCDKPQDFLASMRTHACLQGSPTFDILSSYGIDLIGLSPDPLPGCNSEAANSSSSTVFKILDKMNIFSPVSLNTWERIAFSEMARFSTIYLAVRNLIIFLWHDNPKTLLTAETVSNHCFVRGLLRIVLCEYWIPRIVNEFTVRGLINIGVCQIPYPLPKPSLEKSSLEPTSDQSKFELCLIGSLNLTSSVALKQIQNALFTKWLNMRNSNNIDSISWDRLPFQLQLIDCQIHSLNHENSLNELTIHFEQCDKNGHGDTDVEMVSSTIDKPMENFLLPIPSLTIKSSSVSSLDEVGLVQLEKLSIPIHYWSDRFYANAIHPVFILAKQNDLSANSISNCLLLQSINTELDENVDIGDDNIVINNGSDTHNTNTNTNGERKSDIINNLCCHVSPDLCVRMQFHVEAVLDLVSQSIATLNPNQSPDSLKSVQKYWDQLDIELRHRITDLTGSKTEQDLIEYFLASIESDLTEPLTLNPDQKPQQRTSYPVACLDKLPAHLMHEMTIDSNNLLWTMKEDDGCSSTDYDLVYVLQNHRFTSTGTGSSVSNNSPHRHDVDQVPVGFIDGIIHNLIGSLIQSTTNMSSTHYPHSIRVTNSIQPDDDSVSLNQMKSKFKNRRNNPKSICLYYKNGIERYVDWVIITLQTQQMQVYFESENSSAAIVNVDETCFSLYLPANMRSVLCSTDPAEQDNTCSEEENVVDHLGCSTTTNTTTTELNSCSAQLITVTLIYDKPWWRDLLRNINKLPLNDDNKIGDDNLNLFAFLPKSRNDRGFCHTFRDLRPNLSNPGILQTHIFGSSADSWWTKSDDVIANAVHNYLMDCFQLAPDIVDQKVHSYVGRLGGHAAGNDGHTKQEILFQKTAWLTLARETGIFLPHLIHSTEGTTETCKPDSTSNISDLIYARNPLQVCGMDALSSSVHCGLELAKLALRLLPYDKIQELEPPTHIDLI